LCVFVSRWLILSVLSACSVSMTRTGSSRLLEPVLSELRGEHLEIHLQHVGGARPVPRRILERPLDFPSLDLAVHSPGSLAQRAGQVDSVPRARLLGRQLCGGVAERQIQVPRMDRIPFCEDDRPPDTLLALGAIAGPGIGPQLLFSRR